MLTTIKVSQRKLRPFKHAQSMSKRPLGLVYIGIFIHYLSYLPDPFPKGLEVDLEGSSAFLTLALLIHIDRLNLFSSLHRCLFNCVTT